MTFERRIVAGLDDIKAVVFECLNCKARVCRPATKIGNVPFSCECCAREWRHDSGNPQPGDVEQDFVQFVKAISTLRTNGQLGFRILLEFDEPVAK